MRVQRFALATSCAVTTACVPSSGARGSAIRNVGATTTVYSFAAMPPPRSRPLVLISNDDGHASVGIQAWYEALAADCDVVLVAPEHEQSASSHALSLRRPLRLRTIQPSLHAVDGTPADCVYVALHAGQRILPRWPD